ncbi:MAG: hypothetical protein ACJ71Q_10145 [Terriglobales bacterium]
MKKPVRFISSLLLAGALLAPVATFAQDRDHDRDDHNKNVRVYDPYRRDYHNWNSDEDIRYRRWYTQTYGGRTYRPYKKLHKKDQQAYWKYQHDNDRDHDRDRDRH